MTKLEAFLAGERPDDVALFLADSYVDDKRLERFGERVEDGTVVIVDGERGRNAFQAATGLDAMTFAGQAMNLEGAVADDLSSGTCPDVHDGESRHNEDGGDHEDGGHEDEGDHEDGDHEDDHHEVQFVFAFVEEQNEAAGGLYAEGDVLHAYARCACGTAYSDRWRTS